MGIQLWMQPGVQVVTFSFSRNATTCFIQNIGATWTLTFYTPRTLTPTTRHFRWLCLLHYGIWDGDILVFFGSVVIRESIFFFLFFHQIIGYKRLLRV